MLTDSARQHASREKLQDFFSPGPDACFEIDRGRRINAGEYAFPIVLFGTGNTSSRPRYSKIILTRSGKDDWAVDKLPLGRIRHDRPSSHRANIQCVGQ